MAEHAHRVGQDLGDYHLIRWLGGGSFGDVYLGEHIRTQARTAVKVLQTRLTHTEDLREFLNEARTFRLRHPHIIQLLDFGIHSDDFPYLVMEYATHGTLRDHHLRGTQLPLATILSYVIPLASALQYAHDHQIIHRDVKPENMLLDEHLQVKLSDFGIAAVAHSSHSLRTQEGIGGTLPYMAPEQIQGKPRPASDQYALGIVIYEWLTGNRPFKGTAVEVAMQHSLTPPPPLRDHLPMLSSNVEQVILTALAKDFKARFASVEAFATALKQASGIELTGGITLPIHSTQKQSPGNFSPDLQLDVPSLGEAPPSVLSKQAFPTIPPSLQAMKTVLPYQPSTPTISSQQSIPFLIPSSEKIATDSSFEQEAAHPDQVHERGEFSLPGASLLPTETLLAGPSSSQAAEHTVDLLSIVPVVQERKATKAASFSPLPITAKRKKLSTRHTIVISGLLVFLFGVSSLLYFPVTHYTASLHATATTSAYVQAQMKATHVTQDHIIAAHRAYDALIKKNGIMSDFDSQGTNFNPYESTLTPLNVSSLQLAWEYRTSIKQAAEGYEEPIEAEGIVYVISGVFHEGYTLRAINASTGEMLWKTPATYGVPAYINDVVYAGSNDHYLHAYQAKTGKLLWSLPADNQRDFHDFIISNGVLYVSSYNYNEDVIGAFGSLYAINLTTAQFLWKRPLPFPIRFVVNDNTMYTVSYDDKVTALDAQKGSFLWSVSMKSRSGYIGGLLPVIDNGILYTCSSDSMLYAFDIRTRATLWTKSFQGMFICDSLALANGVLYTQADNFQFYALDARQGTLLWQAKLDDLIEAPAIANGVVYVPVIYKGLYAFNASGCKQSPCSPIWHVDDSGLSVSTPAIAKGRVYIGLGDELQTFRLPQM